jgi:hypothetical protein
MLAHALRSSFTSRGTESFDIKSDAQREYQSWAMVGDAPARPASPRPHRHT